MSLQPFHVRGGLNADGQRVMKIADPVAADDAVNLRTLQSQSGVHFVARLSNLPSVQDPDPTRRPLDGQLYFVKFDLAGNRIDRLYAFDDSIGHTGPIATLTVESDNPADAATITALVGTQDIGRPMALSGNGVGAIADLTAQASGVITATLTTPGTGYAIGDKETVLGSSLAFPGLLGNITFTVTRLGGAAPMGGYRIVNIKDWIKPTMAEGDQPYGMQSGDLEFVTENNHEAIKVFTGGSWKTLFSVDNMQAAIASLSLFEGTSQQVGGTVPGAIAFDAMPDLTATDAATAAANLAKVGHYWTYVGTAGRVVVAGDPNGIGRDLLSATMQVGDWIQIANRGTATAPNLVYVHIGGDLLAKSRADVLYGLKTWTAGNYEQDSLVNYQGSIWRATGPVTPTDTAPGTVAVAGTPAGPGGTPPAVPAVTAAPWQKVPLTAGVKNVPTDGDLPATAPASDVYLVLNSTIAGNKPGLFSYDPGTTAWVQLGGGAAASSMDLTGGSMMLGIGAPIGSIMAWPFATAPAGWLICDGSAVNATDYPELTTLLATNTDIKAGHLPDFRGSFLRGAGLNGNGIWGDAAHTPGKWQDQSTARPNSGFTGTTNNTGSHDHGSGAGGYNNCWKGGDCNGSTYMVRNDQRTGYGGAHDHTVTITGGGDAETRPKNWAVHWIIKASDVGVRYRAVTP